LSINKIVFFLLFPENDIKNSIANYRSNFPKEIFSPKLHMLEDHVIPFIGNGNFLLDSLENKKEN